MLKTSSSKKHFAGNSLVEYILPVTIVGVVLMITLVSIQPTLTYTTLSAIGTHPSEINARQAPVRQFGENPAFKDIIITLDDGTQITLPEYPSDMALAIETEGVNGTTEKLLASLDNLIKALEAKGKLEAAESAQLKALSNSGHNIADIIGKTETVIEGFHGNKQQLIETYNQYRAGDYKQNWLYSLSYIRPQEIDDWKRAGHQVNQFVPVRSISPSTLQELEIVASTDPFDSRLQPSYISTDLAAFLNQYHTAQQTGALKNPQIKSVVQDLSKNLMLVTAQFRTTIHKMGDKDQYQATPDKLRDMVSSQLAHNDSKGICRTGNAQDNGIQCN